MHNSIVKQTLLLMFFLVNIAFSQTKQPVVFHHPLSMRLPSARIERNITVSAVPETTRILVAMIEFQPDNDLRTSGNGSFDFSATTKKIIDPPPHDRTYVQNHMAFAENYFRKVSDGKHFVKATVLDSVYRVPHSMAYYSPLRTSTNNIEMGQLVEDTWKKVDSVSPGIAYEQYDAFMIFHAGIGRDVDLTSLYGYDPTPFDLPSLYINLPALRNMFGETYNGVAVRDSAYFIANSIIIPETESRELEGIGGTVPLPLGINGLIVASIGSHLGLPDLFDTKTGNSGIGRFGLMDGQSIFSWNGLFPPEPSAWEKYFLGWVQPITVPPGDVSYSIPAVGLNTNADTIYKVPISAKEYFLVENRNRDANRDTVSVTMAFNGETIVRSWGRDTVGLNAFFQDSLYGVITDVDEFDWSLPGGIDRNTKELYDGGLLIWHIDEKIINAGYASDAVNADPNHRGVDLEEADGSQDIGQSYGLFTAGSGSEDGWPFDYWYDGNPVTLNVQVGGNAFTPASHPDSRSYGLANSHIYIKNFSKRGPRMTANIQVGDDQIKPLAGFPKSTQRFVNRNSVTVGEVASDNSTGIIIGTENYGPAGTSPLNYNVTVSMGSSRIFGWKLDGSVLFPSGDSSGLLANAEESSPYVGRFLGKIAVEDINNDFVPDLTIGENPAFSPFLSEYNDFKIWTMKDADNNNRIDELYNSQSGTKIITSPVISDSCIAYGTQLGMVYLISHNGGTINSFQVAASDTSEISGASLWSQPSTFIAVTQNGKVGIVTPAGVSVLKDFYDTIPAPAVAGTISPTIGKRIAFVTKQGNIYLVDSTLSVSPGFPVSTGRTISNAPALADVDGDGQKDIVVFSGNRIYAINATGALLDNFPITVSSTTSIATAPIVADVDGNRNADIIAVTREGLIVAYDKTGGMAAGFPVQSGVNTGSTPAVFYMPSPCLSCIDIGMAVASDDGNVYAWRTGGLIIGPNQPPRQPWPQLMHDAQNTGLDESALTIISKSQDFFPATLAYNWPNPVGPEHGWKTHIRYYVGQAANVTIKIFDLAGDLVTEMKGPGVGGYDNEVEWNVADIQSGIYFAHIDAQGATVSGNAVIKIAVVK